MVTTVSPREVTLDPVVFPTPLVPNSCGWVVHMHGLAFLAIYIYSGKEHRYLGGLYYTYGWPGAFLNVNRLVIHYWVLFFS